MRNFLIIIQLFIGRRNLNFTLLKSLVIRFSLISTSKMVFKERVILLAKFARIIFLLPIRFKKTRKTSVVINGGSGELQKERQVYVKKYTNQGDSLFIFPYPNKIYFSKFTIGLLFRITKLNFFFGCVLLLDVFKSNPKENARKYLFFYFYLLQIVMLDRKSTNVYVLQIWMPESYAVSLIASQMGYNVTMITSSSPIHCNNRYVYAPLVNIAHASRFQIEEINVLKKRKHFVVKSVELWGPENVVDFENVKPIENPKYDIAIYSGGSWARDHLNRRIMDGDKVTSDSKNNNYYKVFQLIFDTIIELKKEFNLKVIIFPHPHEKSLFEKGVIPPYKSEADDNDIEIDLGSGNSISQFFNVKVGVSTVSTSIFDRIHLGLIGHVFSGENFKGFMLNADYLGSYKSICFDDKNDLREKIIMDLNLEGVIKRKNNA